MTVENNQLADLLEYVSMAHRVCPMPDPWHQLWEMLPDRHRGLDGTWVPPVPLILGAWWHTVALEKMIRLKEHIEYAAANGALDQVDRFLRSLPDEQWHTAGDGQGDYR